MSHLRPCDDDHGFTLVEVLIVAVLLSTLTGILTAFVPNMWDHLAVARSTDRLVRALQHEIRLARHTGRDQVIRLNQQSSEDSLTVNGKRVGLEPGVSVQFVTAAEAGEDSEQGAIIVFGGGGSSGGRLEVKRGHIRAAIDVDWLSGRVRQAPGQP